MYKGGEIMEDLLNTRETAEYLGFHPETIRRFAREGTLPCIRLGRKRLRFRKEELEQWMDLYKNTS
jgi:excisionase family DNA binding protein